MRYTTRWRAPAHCGMANLVRSGTKQPQSFPASAADQARQLLFPSRLFIFHTHVTRAADAAYCAITESKATPLHRSPCL